MLHLQMLEEQKAWKQKVGFDRVKIIAQMDAQRFRTDFDSGPFHMKLYNPRSSHTPAKYTLEMRVDVERLRMETVISQPVPPPQCDLSPRRLPAVGTGLNKPGAYAESQSMEERK